MSKIGLVIEREYTQKVKKKSFILLTLLMPILFLAMMIVPAWLATSESEEKLSIAVVDNVGKYYDVLENTDEYTFVHIADFQGDVYNNEQVRNYDVVMVFSQDLLLNPSGLTMYAEKQVSSRLKQYVVMELESWLKEEKIATYDIPNLQEIIDSSKVSLNVKTIKLSDEGEEKSSSFEVASVVGMVATFLIYMFVFMYGGMVMRAVIEEKTNRIIEVLVCSVKPFELMMGKIIAVALVGLTQIAIWVVITLILFTFATPIMNLFTETDVTAQMVQVEDAVSKAQESGVMQEVMDNIMALNPIMLLVFFIVYFIGGYLLYASIFAAIGSAVDAETDTQQFMLPITIPIIFALYAGIYSANNPDGPLAFWTSIVPFTSPIVMMVRLPFGVPWWQLALSVALLVVTFVGSVWLCAKIYRVGILMYGKKVTFKEMLKWVKY